MELREEERGPTREEERGPTSGGAARGAKKAEDRLAVELRGKRRVPREGRIRHEKNNEPVQAAARTLPRPLEENAPPAEANPPRRVNPPPGDKASAFVDARPPDVQRRSHRGGTS